MKKTFTTSVLMALVAILVSAPVAHAGGTGDFWWHKSCKPKYYGYSSTANLDVTNYDIATGQRYHIDVDAGGFRVQGLYFNGSKVSDWNDIYIDRANRSSVNTIRAVWFYGPYLLATTTECTIRV